MAATEEAPAASPAAAPAPAEPEEHTTPFKLFVGQARPLPRPSPLLFASELTQARHVTAADQS